jgi:hypothetical protein
MTNFFACPEKNGPKYIIFSKIFFSQTLSAVALKTSNMLQGYRKVNNRSFFFFAFRSWDFGDATIFFPPVFGPTKINFPSGLVEAQDSWIHQAKKK